ncbi:alpha/beta fold hydrolase [Mycolicibacterium thermoresistibile]
MAASDIELDPSKYDVHKVVLDTGQEVAYVREGIGGVPLLLLHGWPETMRIWWRNIEPLAKAGFEVIVPDLRGFGVSGQPKDGFYDVAANSHDMKALLTELGHPAAVVAGGDYGGMVTQDFSNRYPDSVLRQVIFNCLTPMLPELYEQNGVGGDALAEVNAASEHVVRQGNEADQVAAELPSEELRRAYIGGFYTYRYWAAMGSFSADEIAFMTEPYGDAEKFRSSLVLYEAFMDPAKMKEPPMLASPLEKRTLILYGMEDRAVGPKFSRRMKLACKDAVGPFLIEDAGHFLQFEQADLFNEAVRVFCVDLLNTQGG